MNKRLLGFIASLLLLSGILNAQQITVTGGLTATQLANMLAGSNIVVSNAVLTGAAGARGTFSAGTSTFPMASGVILSTGNVSTAPGPNTAANTTTDFGGAGTAQMTALAGIATHDAITLEFDFTVQSEFIQFDYIFASEEYPEYAPPEDYGFNDVFAFFISGPGITGEENIALIPGTSNPVAINNLNAITNTQYYIDNLAGPAVSFDAYTTTLTARKEGLTPCQTYHLKLVIADAGDGLYNSAVFLEENSLIQGTVDVTTNTINSDNIALEGCVKASFTFSLDQPSTIDKTITYQIAGTATNGVDYTPIATSLTIPAGQTSAQVFIDAISDGFTEPQETIYIIYKPEVCSGYDTAKLYINDAQPITYTLDPTDLDCNGDHSGEILVNASGGFTPYTYSVKDDNGVTNNYTSNPITGLDAGTYTVYVYDRYGCTAKAQVVGGLFNAGTTFLPDGSGVTYTSAIHITGFSAGTTLSNLNMLQNICLNMEHSYMGDLEIRLIAPGGQNLLIKSPYGGGSTDLGEPIATGPIDGSAGSLLTDPGVGYDYCFSTTPMHGTMVSESNTYFRNYTDSQGHSYYDSYLPGGVYTPEAPLSTLLGTPINGTWTVQVTDHMYLDNGYIFNWSISFIGDMPDSIVTIHEPAPIVLNHFVTNATCGDSNGAINISVNGNYPTFTYLWSTGATTEDISGVPAGVYTVTVTDAHTCTNSGSFSVSNNGTMYLSANITPVTCNGNNTGAINITLSGGATPYTFLWSNSATTEDISSLAAGTYTVTVTDQNSCQVVRLFDVTTNPAINIMQINLQNEQCGTHNGSISINALGGSGSFGYLWNNSFNTPTITNLAAGTYTVTVSDAYGCTATQSYSIVNDVSNCTAFCYLDVLPNVITDELCGNGNGSINVNITNATPPYVIHWSTGATTEDITGLHQGNYTITVTDANQCEKIKTFTVGNNTGNLSISQFTVNNETCGTGNGSIDITVNGGALPYQYHWSNAATTEDLIELSAFNYTVTVTDANNCNLIQTFTLQNNAGNLNISGIVNDEICNADNGSITQTVSGGFGTISYLWSNNSTQQSLINIPAGNYTCNITDEGGCAVVMNYTVINLPGNLAINGINVTNEICTNGQGSISLNVSGTSPVYHWNTGAITSSITGLSAGTYSCTVSNPSGCSTTTGPIYLFDAAGTLVVTTDHIIDEICNNGHGSVVVNVSGGTIPYTFLWSNGAIGQNLYSVHAGNYQLTVTDSNGCQYNYNAVVNNEPGTLTIQNAVITNEVCGNGNGAINLMVTGSTTPYTYIWTNGITTQDLSNLHAGDYTVTVTSAQGCVQTHTSTVINIANGMSLSWQITNETCSNGLGGIDLSVSGGTLPYTYAWSNSATTQDLTGLSSGTYICTVTDNTSCHSVTDTIIVNDHATNMTYSYHKWDENCNNNLGSINLSVIGGVSPIVYQWSNSATTEDITNLSAGLYSFTATDANNCVINGSITINDAPGTLTFSQAVTNEHCNNNLGAIDLTISGGTTPYTFLWNGGITTEDRTALNSGTYSCTITDANGCQVLTGPIIVADDPGTLEIVSMAVTNEVCNNNHGQINLTVGGGTSPYTYLWSSGPTTQDLINLTSGIYIVTVTDNGGCSVIGQTVVNDISGSFSISNHVITDEHCSNGQGAINITVQGGTTPYTYVWSNGPTTQDISNLSAGNYEVYLNDASGCTANGSYQVQNLGSNFQITQSVITDEVCGSGTGSINISYSGGTAPFLFNWSNGSQTEDLTNLNSGNYSVTITDAFGCTVVNSYTVNNSPGTMVLSGSSTDEFCGNGLGSVNINVFGGATPYIYIWNNGAVVQDLINIHSGNYSVTVTDQNGCAGTYSDIVLNNTNGFLAAIDTVINETCGNLNGAVQLLVSGGQVPYTFLWSNSATTQNISNLAAGNYNVQVTDNLGCSYYLQANIANLTGNFIFSFTNVVDESCGNSDGFINIEVSGGTTPYTYLWSNSATTQDITDLFQGDYTVTVTDGAGCSLIQTFHINNANVTNIQISGLVTDVFCTAVNGSINVTITGGMNPMLYSWSNGSSNEDLNNIGAGTYTIVVADDAGCSNSNSFTVNAITNPNLAFSNISVANDYCNSGTGSIIITATGAPYYYYYVNGSMVPYSYIYNLTAGIYNLSIFDPNGCHVDSTVVVSNYVPFTVTHTEQNEICDNGNGSVNISVVGSGLTYQWSNGAVTQDISGLSAGTYTCTVSNGSCTELVTAVILNIVDFTVSSVIDAEYCSDSNGAIDQTISGATMLTYLWSNGAITQDISGLIAGNYTCTVTNSLTSCIQIESYVVPFQTSGVFVNSIVAPDTCGQGLGSIFNTVSGGSGNYSYEWNYGPTTASVTGLFGGNYSLIVIDNNDNCHINSLFTIADLSSFTASGVTNNASCSTCNDGSIDVTVNNLPGFTNTYTYNWSNSATTQDVTSLLPGNYSVTITSGIGCDTVLYFTVNYNIGIASANSNPVTMQVYPNPAGDYVVVDIYLPGNAKGNLVITDVERKIVYKTNVEGIVKQNINTISLAPGVYQISLVSDRVYLNRKLVIMR
jgi:subtilisin-like proprotein convertase family protein